MNYQIGGYGHTYTRFNEVDSLSHVDVLILGSSHAYRGVDPRIFEKNGISAFVLGSSSQTPLQTLGLLKEYLPKLNPRIVLYEVYPGIFESDGVESSLDILANHKLNWFDIRMALRVNHLKSYHVLINDIFRESFGMNKGVIEPLETEDDQYVSGGYVERVITTTDYTEKIKVRNYTLREKQLQALEEIMDVLKSSQTPVVLIQAPISERLYTSRLNNAEVDEVLSQFGPYYNFNELMDLGDDRFYYDNHHLNQHGVEVFNKFLIEEILTKF